MDVKDRIRKARISLKLSQEALAKETGSQRTTVAGYESGVSLPRPEFLKELSIKYKINPNWILTGQGNMLNETSMNSKSRFEQEFEDAVATNPKFAALEERLARLEKRLEDRNIIKGDFTAEPEPEYEAQRYVKVPYVDDIAAGPPRTQSEDQTQFISIPDRFIRNGARCYVAGIRGSSMVEAGIRDGDKVIVCCTDVPRDSAIQVVRYDGKSTIKRLREIEGTGWELHYEDGSGKVILADSVDYQVQGEFVAILPENAVQAPFRKAPGRTGTL